MIRRVLAAFVTVPIPFLFLFGCGEDCRKGTIMPTNNFSDSESRKSKGWALGPLGGADIARNITFRAAAKLNGSASGRPPKIVVPRPIIQGHVEALCVGEDGSRYVGGSFSGDKDFCPGPSYDYRSASGKSDGFVTCFDQSGKYRWTSTFGAMESVNVRGIAVSDAVVYALCDESEGHVAILAMESATGAPKRGFGIEGSQMFRYGERDIAAAIRCHGDALYVLVRCIEFPEGRWPSYSFCGLLSVDRATGSTVESFGKMGMQTIGNASGSPGPMSNVFSPDDSVEPLGLAISQSRLFVVGKCKGKALGIGRQGVIGAGSGPMSFVAAMQVDNGIPVRVFGENGLVLMPGNAIEAADAVVSGSSLYVTGCWRVRSNDNAFLAAMNSETGVLEQQFGGGGIKVFGPWSWESGWSVRVNGHVVYVAGGYINGETEGVFVAAFDRINGDLLTSFGNRGSQLIDGVRFGNQGRIETFGDDVFLIARTDPSQEAAAHEVKIGETVIKKGDATGVLIRLLKDGRFGNSKDTWETKREHN